MENSEKKPVFRELQADDAEPETTEIESLCVNCGENGITRLLLTKIPFYKEIILMSFECEHCGLRNNEIQSGGRIQDRGVKFEVRIQNSRDLNRQVIRSDTTTVTIPELEFEIPAQSQKGEITTVEGILDRSIAGLEQDQPVRRALDPEGAEKIDEFVQKLKNLRALDTPFTLVLDDPAGNSFVENPVAPSHDPATKILHYTRTKEQDHALGIYDAAEINDEEENGASGNGELVGEKLENEVLHFGTNCPSCNAPCETNMKVTNIPYFKEVIIMATTCDYCGLRTNEVKSGTGIADKGVKIQLKITDPIDLTRDVLKSETCHLSIPELDLEVGAGTLGGRFTTLEGLLTSIKDQLLEHNPLVCGDSAAPSFKERMAAFGQRLEDMISGKERDIHVVLDDCAGNIVVENQAPLLTSSDLRNTTYSVSVVQANRLDINSSTTVLYTVRILVKRHRYSDFS
nr:EOG090X06TU [Eulimnadia texana]